MDVTPSVAPATSELAGERPRFSRRLRSRFMAGLVLVVPVWITVVVVTVVFRFLRDLSLWLIEAVLLTPLGDSLLSAWGLERSRLANEGLAALPLLVQWAISAVSIVLTIVLLYVMGTVTTNVVGKRFVRIAEKVVDRVPLVKLVYYASKKVLETFAGGGAQAFKQVVLVPYPSKQLQSVGFVTHVSQDEQTGDTLYTVFVAMAPHLTSAFVFVTRQDDVVELDWNVEQALKVIISGGMLMPDKVPFPPGN